ncbi:MAG: hypothetical protein NC210_10375 [[Clostridium] fimetarium]|nr:hypothetical protein [Alistipes timonensis]MCM1406818.1 hypothetical protein [[Clostridium] fimetarium]
MKKFEKSAFLADFGPFSGCFGFLRGRFGGWLSQKMSKFALPMVAEKNAARQCFFETCPFFSENEGSEWRTPSKRMGRN